MALNPEIRRTVIGAVGGGLAGLIGGAFVSREFIEIIPNASTLVQYLETGVCATAGAVGGAYAGTVVAHIDTFAKMFYHDLKGK